MFLPLFGAGVIFERRKMVRRFRKSREKCGFADVRAERSFPKYVEPPRRHHRRPGRNNLIQIGSRICSLLGTNSILYASTSSRTLRSKVRSEDRNNDRANCWVWCSLLRPCRLGGGSSRLRAECRYSRGPDARKNRTSSTAMTARRNRSGISRQRGQDPTFDEELPDRLALIAGIDWW